MAAPQTQSGRPLSPFDAQFLAADTGNMHGHYCGLARFGPHPKHGPLTREHLIGHIESRLPHIEPLRWRLRSTPLGLDHPVFVDGEVDVAAQVTSATLPRPGGDRELADEAAQLMAERLPRDRPLWRFHFIDGLDDGHTAVGFVVHHAAADALAMATIFAQIMDVRDEAPRLGEATTPSAREPGRAERLARGWLRAASFPARAVRAGASATPHLDQVPMLRSLPGARHAARLGRAAKRAAGGEASDPAAFHHAPRTRLNGALTPGRSVAFGEVEVELVKRLKSHHGVTFNDIVVAAVGGGLRRRLEAGDELPEDPLVAFVPTNVRTTNDESSITNAISSFIVAIPTDEPTAEGRVLRAAEAMTEAKARHRDVPDSLLSDVNALIPAFVFNAFAGGVLRLMGSGLVDPPVNLLLSNVPGPPIGLELDGYPAEAIYPLSLIFEGATLNVTVVSYDGRLLIGVVGDADGVPDAWEIVADIESEFAALESEASLSRASSPG